MISYFNKETIYGICVLQVVTHCEEYEITVGLVECKTCDTGLTLVHTALKLCVYTD